MPVDTGRGDETRTSPWPEVLTVLPPGRIPLAQICHGQSHRAGGPTDGQLPGDVELRRAHLGHPRSRERPCRMVVHVEEVGTAQVGVPVGFAGVHPGRVQRRLDACVLGFVRVDLYGPANVLDLPSHVGDHHVPGRELRAGVTGFEEPARRRHCLFLPSEMSATRPAWPPGVTPTTSTTSCSRPTHGGW